MRTTIGTRRFGDGPHQIAFCAYDYGFPDGNLGCTPAYTVKVDNTSPHQPVDLQVDGGSGTWHAENDFDLNWELPDQDGGSPIAAVRYRILTAGGALARPLVRLPRAATVLHDVQVPGEPGLYRLEIMLEDEAGNVGAPARTALRFDDARPGAARPVLPSGWLSRNELPYLQRVLKPADPLPVSGIQGYAVAVNREPLARPCADSRRCFGSEVDLRDGPDGNVFEIADLPEGTSYVHSVAVSGSGVSSAEVGHAALRVDKTDPVTVLSGASGGWTNDEVVLEATAVDAESGMSPAIGEPEPFTAIRIGSAAPVLAAGNHVSAGITEEGVHTVAFYARDLAGNVNDGASTGSDANRPPQFTRIRIDRSRPGVAFLNEQDPTDPEVIRAVVRDPLSGPDPTSGQIVLRRVGRPADFSPLPTELVDGVLQARWDSDAYPAGEYEFRASAEDLAGNSQTTGRRIDGSVMVLPNPVKLPTAIRGSLGGTGRKSGRVRRRTLPYGSTATFRGRLTAGLGSPLSGEVVTVVERFSSGAQTRRMRRKVRTDRRGRFSIRLARGPSRRVTAVYDGTRTLTRSVSRPVRLRVRTGLSFSVSSHRARIGGAPVTFSGRVKRNFAAIPRQMDVTLEYKVRGRKWTEFRTLPVNAMGRFRTRYAFTDQESRGVRFRFRVSVSRQPDWPYAAAHSDARTVTGR